MISKSLFEPIRINQEISTFPLFQLAQFSQLISDLGVNPSGYVDSYNPYSGHWEQQPISTVRAVESEQRLLYRIRKSFVEGLSEEECPGLRHEVGLQLRPNPVHHNAIYSNSTPTPAKRPAPETNEDQISKYYRVDYAGTAGPGPGYVPAGNMQQYAPTSAPPSQPYPTPPSYPVHLSNKLPSPIATYHYSTSIPKEESNSILTPEVVSFPHHPHPPLKRWPNDYAVCEISAGFKQMDALVLQQPTLTQRAAFERVFGCRYVKSTVCRHRGVWRRADDNVRMNFEAMGTDESAVWGDFVKQVEGRRKSDGQTTTAAVAASAKHVQRHTIMQELQFAPGMQMHLGNVDSPALLNHTPADSSTSEYQGTGGDNGPSPRQMPDLEEPVMGSLGPPPVTHMRPSKFIP